MSDALTGEQIAELVNIGMMDLALYHHEDWRSVQDHERPYNGQPHTDHGERGKTEVRGVTFRDLYDAFVTGFFLASRVPEDQRGSIYELDLNRIDVLAAWQNMSCEIERRMGIYPNVPPLEVNEEQGA